jgi:branched-subunit amino acid aminotransferase/4-amino-4-deoxychorismate lyase/ketosteroid isomerase-like protein
LALRILTALGEHPAQGANYLRLVVTRGFGDLGINPKTAFGCNIYGIISNITLYPELLYERGLDLAVCRGTRRTTATFLDPEIKSCNYLNNIVALLETNNQNCQETLMLTPEGFIAEATCDNIFLVCREPGWDSDPSRVLVCTPHQGCLKGITRNLVIKYATRHKYRIDCSAQIMPDQLFGDAKEVFLTGTAAGIIPVVSIDNHKVGDGKPGPITQMFRALLQSDIANPVMGVKTTSSAAQIEQYWALRTNAEESDSLFINQMFEAIDSREWDKLPMFFSTDIVYERPGYSPLIGYARVAHFYMHERVIASGNHLIEGIVSNDNNAACWGRFVGKNKNGSEIDERFSDVYTFHNGKIVKRRSFFYRPAI